MRRFHADATPVTDRGSSAADGSGPAPTADRLVVVVREYFAFVWRLMRRFGLPPADADDATQQVMIVLTRRLADIQPGSERAFLSRTAVHVALKARRSWERRREVTDALYDELPCVGCDPDRLLDQRRARERLDQLLSDLPFELRVVLVLFEIEGLSQPEIAAALDIPYGTVASRIRRARKALERLVLRNQPASRVMGVEA